MRAAIYARRSAKTDQGSPDGTSCARQIAGCTAFAQAQGWTVLDEYVFVDDGITGAVFDEERRPGLARMLNAIESGARPPFDVVIMSEVSRLGRGMMQTGYINHRIATRGVAVWTYLNRQQVQMASAEQQVVTMLGNFGAQLEREKLQQRTRDALFRRTQLGYATTKPPFGYRNVRVNGHSDRHIVPEEAAVIVRIFEMYRDGYGFRAIAQHLNTEGVRSPKGNARDSTALGWSITTVKHALRRPLYRGVIEFGRWHRDREGRQLRRTNADPEVMRIDAPHLRIVPPDLAAAADAKHAQWLEKFPGTNRTPKARGRGALGPGNAKHLLSGVLRCACGASLECHDRSHGRRPGGVYICSAFRRFGRCEHRFYLKTASTEAAVLDVLDAHLFRTSWVEQQIRQAVRDVQAHGTVKSVEQEIKQLARDVTRLTAAITAGAGSVPTVVAELMKRQARLDILRQRQAASGALDAKHLLRLARQRAAEWRTMLRTDGRAGNRFLRALFPEGIRLKQPRGLVVAWTAEVDLAGMFTMVPWSIQGLSRSRRPLKGPARGLQLSGTLRSAAA